MRKYNLPFDFLGLKLKHGCFYGHGHPEDNNLIRKNLIKQLLSTKLLK